MSLHRIIWGVTKTSYVMYAYIDTISDFYSIVTLQCCYGLAPTTYFAEIEHPGFTETNCGVFPLDSSNKL